MITVKQSYKFPGGPSATEAYYTMASSGTCAAVTPVSGTVVPGTTVEFAFSFNNEECFTNEFTLTTWDDVCLTPVSNTFTVPSPCSTLSGTISNTPSTTNPFIFTVTPSGGTPGYDINWEYPGVFRPISETASSTGARVIEFQPVFIGTSSGLLLPGDVMVKATITDSVGCQQVISYTYSFCQPTTSNVYAAAHCIEAVDIGAITARNVAVTTLKVTQCAGTTTDWNTLELDYDTTKLYAVLGKQTDTEATITIYGIRPTSLSSYNISYSVANSYGIRSTLGTITVNLPVCPLAGGGTVSGPVFVAPNATKLLTGEGAGTVKTLALEDIVFSAE